MAIALALLPRNSAGYLIRIAIGILVEEIAASYGIPRFGPSVSTLMALGSGETEPDFRDFESHARHKHIPPHLWERKNRLYTEITFIAAPNLRPGENYRSDKNGRKCAMKYSLDLRFF